MECRSVRATLLALLTLWATAANAQIIHYVSSGTINYDVRGRDILLDSPNSFVSYLTLTDGGIISCNDDAADGLEGVEVFNANELHMDGGALVGDGSRKGGVRLHNVAALFMTGGTVNVVRGRDGATTAQSGGAMGELSLQDHSVGYFYGGSVSLVSVYNNARLEVRGGHLGAGGIRLFGGSVQFYGSDFRAFGFRNAVIGGFQGVSYMMTGLLADGGRLTTSVFQSGATFSGKTPPNRLLVNDALLPLQAAAPEPATVGYWVLGIWCWVLVGRPSIPPAPFPPSEGEKGERIVGRGSSR